MTKAVFLAILAVMTPSVWGMNPLDKKTDMPAVRSLREVGKYISDQGLSLKSVGEYASSNRPSDDDGKLSVAATMLKRSLVDRTNTIVNRYILNFLLIYTNFLMTLLEYLV